MSGNRASELGQVDQGEDFSRINETELGVAEYLEVDAKHDHGEVSLTPVVSKGRELGLRHSHSDLELAQLVDETPPVEFMVPGAGKVQAHPNRLAQAVSRNRNRESLIWYGVTKDDQMACTGDRIIVRRDTLESAYSCRECKGSGYSGDACPVCKGSGKDGGSDCRSCMVLGYERESKFSCGNTPCRDCRGTGWRSGVIIPEVAQDKPISGIVVSLGPQTSLTKLGDRVMHSRFAGHHFEAAQGDSFTILRESELLSLIRSSV